MAVKQNDYFRKIVHVFIVYDLDAWPRNLTNNFKLKNCLFGATNKAKNSNKVKYVCSGYGITFDSAGSCIFVNDFARNIFAIGNNSSSHADNHKNNFLVLGEGPA